MMTIAIIGAMQLEIEYIQEQLQNQSTKKIHNFTFWEGEIDNIHIVVLLSGVGKVSAAVGTTLLIEHYHPDLIINTGVAGGLRNTQIHDIVLADEVKHHDIDLTSFGYELGQPSQMPPVFLPDGKWNELAWEVAQNFTKKLHRGLIVSGDSFISNAMQSSQIFRNFPSALAVEMEAASIAQTCHLLNTPFIVLRAISDPAGQGTTISYETFVAEAGKLSAQINISLIKKIAEMQNPI